MSLRDQLENIPPELPEEVIELRQIIVRQQKQLKKAKERTEDLVETTHQAAYDAMMSMGKSILSKLHQ